MLIKFTFSMAFILISLHFLRLFTRAPSKCSRPSIISPWFSLFVVLFLLLRIIDGVPPAGDAASILEDAINLARDYFWVREGQKKWSWPMPWDQWPHGIGWRVNFRKKEKETDQCREFISPPDMGVLPFASKMIGDLKWVAHYMKNKINESNLIIYLLIAFYSQAPSIMPQTKCDFSYIYM